MHSITIVVTLGMIACAAAGAISYSKHYDEGLSALEGHAEVHHDYFHHPQYKYEYGVQDHHTG